MERIKGCWRGLNPDEQIAEALRDGLSEDRSGIDSNPVHRNLNEKTSEPRHSEIPSRLQAEQGRCTVHIAHVIQVTLHKGLGVPARGEFYDLSGRVAATCCLLSCGSLKLQGPGTPYRLP